MTNGNTTDLSGSSCINSFFLPQKTSDSCQKYLAVGGYWRVQENAQSKERHRWSEDSIVVRVCYDVIVVSQFPKVLGN